MRRFVVAEMSMAPALRPGDHFLARRIRRPRRGDVAFVPHPDRADFWLAKRIIALEGEMVEIEGGGVSIDGVTLREPWTIDDTSPDGRWQVPSGHVFVLSDARHRTLADSRTFGPVPYNRAYAAMFRYRRGVA